MKAEKSILAAECGCTLVVTEVRSELIACDRHRSTASLTVSVLPGPDQAARGRRRTTGAENAQERQSHG